MIISQMWHLRQSFTWPNWEVWNFPYCLFFHFNWLHVLIFHCSIQVTGLIIAKDCRLPFQERYANSIQGWEFGCVNLKEGLNEGRMRWHRCVAEVLIVSDRFHLRDHCQTSPAPQLSALVFCELCIKSVLVTINNSSCDDSPFPWLVINSPKWLDKALSSSFSKLCNFKCFQ